MDASSFAAIIAKAKTLIYNNFDDINHEDELYYKQLINDNDVVILSDNSLPSEISWAVNSSDVLTNALLKLKGVYKIKAFDVNIITSIINAGYKIVTEYQDYFHEDINSIDISSFDASSIMFAQHMDVSVLSAISYACAGLSRGFNGENVEWFSEWFNKGSIIIEKDNDIITGYCCVSIYANGSILWIRNIAVLPKYQNNGIGRKLIEKALCFGKYNGAIKAFLHVDKLNYNAINLYKQCGFVPRLGYEVTLINQ
ncbi:MAG: GNAT family N-acetyltransferase [Eubacteriales bacterium]